MDGSAPRTEGWLGTPMLDEVKPSDFDFAECRVCGGRTAVPLTWLMRPPPAGEPDPPTRFVIHTACEATLAPLADEPREPDEDT